LKIDLIIEIVGIPTALNTNCILLSVPRRNFFNGKFRKRKDNKPQVKTINKQQIAK
jgi:hypothetical protein